LINFTNREQKVEIGKILQKNDARVYFVGIGGISMSALALLLKRRGVAVAGSDIRKSAVTDSLIKNGIKVRFSHTKESIMSFRPDIAVFSLSVDESNVEYRAAQDMKIPLISRSLLLGIIMDEYKTKIGVSGSHGKSTVTAMLHAILCEAGFSPTVLCGADISDGLGLIEGKRDYFVYEACEYGDSFLNFSPSVQLLLNLELDHTDYFKSEEDIRESFLKSANLAEKCCILNIDSENLSLISSKIVPQLHTFSAGDEGEYKYEISGSNKGEYSFRLYKSKKLIGEYFPLARGRHNLQNAVAAAVSADVLGIEQETVARALKQFSGIKRRLELIKKGEKLDIFYDYAHHPSEIRSLFEALSEMKYERITAVFAPHTYSRTQSFLSSFAKELAKFNTVYVTDIWGAREKAVVGVNSSALAAAVRKEGGNAHAAGLNEVFATVTKIIESDSDCVVLMGAGDLEKYKEKIVEI